MPDRASVPAETFTPAEVPITPEMVADPLVDLLIAPDPVRAVEIVPAWTPNVPEDESVPFWIVPPVSVRPPFWVCVVPPRSSVPPLTVKLLATLPSVPGLARSSMPALTVVPPV